MGLPMCIRARDATHIRCRERLSISLCVPPYAFVFDSDAHYSIVSNMHARLWNTLSSSLALKSIDDKRKN